MSALPQATSPAAFVAFERVLRECSARVQALGNEGLPAAPLRGQLIRPLVTLAGAGSAADERTWQAALAVQYAHEASLLHDDVIDGALQRRGAPTRVAARGVAAALVEGDHLLTSAYRLAARTGSLPFAELFAHAVERTVAGERLQGARRGSVLTLDEYLEVVSGKSGELLGAAFAAAPLLGGDGRAAQFYDVGRRVGVCYQMVDDLLDYCPGASTGKGALGDFRQRIWTWPLAQLPAFHWEWDEAEVLAALVTPRDGHAPPLAAALEVLRDTVGRTYAEVHALLPDDGIVGALLCDWLERAEAGVQAALATAARTRPLPAELVGTALPPASPAAPTLTAGGTLPPSVAPLPSLPTDRELDGFFARNSRSFSFAARLFPRAHRARVADVYAFCRVTDDLADAPGLSAADRAERLDAWLTLCRRGHAGTPTGVAMLDRVLADAARSQVPFRYIEQLVAGMRMDLAPRRYESLADLRVYTHRVASVVGLWLSRLWGVRDELVLERAADLGHAMQLTNILRDVGEDWRAGRLYLPRDLLARFGVDEALITSLVAGAPVPARWRILTEELMAVADAYYDRAFAAIPALPRPVRAPVAVAALVYRGIHDEIRRNGYDNLNRRAHTSLPRKLRLAAGALWRLRRVRAAPPGVAPVLRAAGVALLLALGFAGSVAGQRDPLAGLVEAETRLALDPGDSLLQVERVRWLYRVGVAHERALDEADVALQRMRAEIPGFARRQEPLLDAYEGAFRLLRAKHGSWPPSRLAHAKAGLRLLDAAVQQAPRHIEVRYLRLVSGYHLPGIFGRGDQVRADFAALARLLPEHAELHPPELVREAAAFVLAYGTLEPGVRAALERWHAEHG